MIKSPYYDASLASRVRRGVAMLDEERPWYWTPGSYPVALTTEDADYFERTWRERNDEDDWTSIDKKLACAYYETMTFADYIGAGEAE